MIAWMENPPQLLVDSSAHPCPYLGDRLAILPMRLPLRGLTPSELDTCLEQGDRRQGVLLYRPACPGCQACTPIRLDMTTFAPSRAMQRALRTGRQRLTVVLDRPKLTRDRLELYNLHRRLRGLDQGEDDVHAAEYESFLVDSCCDTWELSYWHQDRLVGCAILDRGATSLSAVYCCYDPRLPGLSVGVFSVMQQVELCRQWQLRWLYLGYWVPGSRAMQYKAGYQPHELRLGGRWQPGSPMDGKVGGEV